MCDRGGRIDDRLLTTLLVSFPDERTRQGDHESVRCRGLQLSRLPSPADTSSHDVRQRSQHMLRVQDPQLLSTVSSLRSALRKDAQPSL